MKKTMKAMAIGLGAMMLLSACGKETSTPELTGSLTYWKSLPVNISTSV